MCVGRKQDGAHAFIIFVEMKITIPFFPQFIGACGKNVDVN